MKNNLVARGPQRFSLLIILPIIAYLGYSGYSRLSPPNGTPNQRTIDAGWAGSFLHDKANKDLNTLVDRKSNSHRYTRCKVDNLLLEGSTKPLSVSTIESQLEQGKTLDVFGNLRFVQITSIKVPCSQEPEGCCQHAFYMRPNTTDMKVYKQIFQDLYMRYLYTIFDSYTPKYILDAGANAGFSTSLFKLLWPDAIVVSVEPDPNNFEALQQNTKGFDGVHAINAGLWGRKARIGQTAAHGEWGKIFKEKSVFSTGGTLAYGVKDLAKMFDIPGFDFVKIDIEGAEGKVFDPRSDFSWIDDAKVISLEVHDYFAGYFGLNDVSSRIDAVFHKRPFSIVSDNEHVMYVSKEIVDGL